MQCIFDGVVVFSDGNIRLPHGHRVASHKIPISIVSGFEAMHPTLQEPDSGFTTEVPPCRDYIGHQK